MNFYTLLPYSISLSSLVNNSSCVTMLSLFFPGKPGCASFLFEWVLELISSSTHVVIVVISLHLPVLSFFSLHSFLWFISIPHPANHSNTTQNIYSCSLWRVPCHSAESSLGLASPYFQMPNSAFQFTATHYSQFHHHFCQMPNPPAGRVFTPGHLPL